MGKAFSKRCVSCGDMFDTTTNASRYCSAACNLIGNSVCNGGCIEWLGVPDKNGYGTMRPFGSRTRRTSRVSFEEFTDQNLGSRYVCHSCDNPKCVNPNHLFAGTQKDNLEDCVAKRRQAVGEQTGPAKLTEEIVRLILDNPGLSAPQLAAEYGVSKESIYNIRHGRTWKHLERAA